MLVSQGISFFANERTLHGGGAGQKAGPAHACPQVGEGGLG